MDDTIVLPESLTAFVLRKWLEKKWTTMTGLL
jgi:hypothetical protein